MLFSDRLTFFPGLVQDDYHSHNPYHNAVHAADVTQAMYCYMKEPKVKKKTTQTHTFSFVSFSLSTHTARLHQARAFS